MTTNTQEQTTNATRNYVKLRKSEPIDYVNVPESLKHDVNSYAVLVDGNCLNPYFQHGDKLLCDPSANSAAGDFVAIWWKNGNRQPCVKRLVLGLPPTSIRDSKFCQALLVVEQLNPYKQLSALWNDVEAIHKVISKI